MNESEFVKSVTKYAYSLKPFALSLTRNIEDAHDLVQETLFRALSSEEKFTEGTNLKAWLYTVMKNIFSNNYRRTKKRNSIIEVKENLNEINSRDARVTNHGESNIAIEH